MKTEDRGTVEPAIRTIGGRRVVLLEEAEYQRLRRKADEWEPSPPAPDEAGNLPSLAAVRVSIALSILRQRRRLGLSQDELARRAGIRLETLNQIEHARRSPSPVTAEKIQRALDKIGQRQPK